MTRLRVMHVLYSLGTGGTEMVLRKLVSGLNPEKFESIVVSIVPLDGTERIPGVRSMSLQRDRRPGFLVPQLVQLFRRETPDVVHSRNWGAIEAVIAARLARVPRCVHSEHGRDINTMNGDPWRRRLFRRLCYAMADEVFAVSNELRDHYAQQTGMSAERIRVIPNGVDSCHFRPKPKPSSLRAQLGIPEGVLLLGTVGRLDPVKDHTTLLTAAETLLRDGIELRVVLVGKGPEHNRLRERIAGNKLLQYRVIFAGEVSHPEDWLAALDIYVLPSRSEGMSNSLLEAMASGLPCVATRVGSNSDLVEEGRSGFLVEAGDAASMARRLEQLAASPTLRQEFGEQARRRAKTEFSLRSMIDNYARLYAVRAPAPTTGQAVLGGAKG